jgi:hypothetical protein
MRSRLLIGVPMTTTTFSHYDEMIDGQGQVRPAYAGYREWYDAQDPRWMVKQGKQAEASSAAPASPSTSMARMPGRNA